MVCPLWVRYLAIANQKSNWMNWETIRGYAWRMSEIRYLKLFAFQREIFFFIKFHEKHLKSNKKHHLILWAYGRSEEILYIFWHHHHQQQQRRQNGFKCNFQQPTKRERNSEPKFKNEFKPFLSAIKIWIIYHISQDEGRRFLILKS